MKIIRFGSSVLSAYEFPTYEADDTIVAQRPPVVQQVGGAAGAFDVYGGDGYPVAPLTVTKKLTLVSSPPDYDSVETLLDALKAATIAAGRSYLWAQPRGAAVAASRYAYAKCIDLSYGEARDDRMKLPVELTFLLPEGLWYTTAVGVQTSSASFQVTNSGNYPAPGVATFLSGASNPGLAISGVCSFDWTGTASGSGLVVNARSYTCTNNGVDAFDDLSIGSGQVAWFWIPPGTHTVAKSGSGTVELDWRHTYV